MLISSVWISGFEIHDLQVRFLARIIFFIGLLLLFAHLGPSIGLLVLPPSYQCRMGMVGGLELPARRKERKVIDDLWGLMECLLEGWKMMGCSTWARILLFPATMLLASGFL